MKPTTYISFGILVLFGFIGSMLISSILHEQFHKFDLRDIDKTHERICYLDSSMLNGYYSFALVEGEEISDEVIMNSEMKAYAISITIMFVFILSVFTIINNCRKKKESVAATTLVKQWFKFLQNIKHFL